MAEFLGAEYIKLNTKEFNDRLEELSTKPDFYSFKIVDYGIGLEVEVKSNFNDGFTIAQSILDTKLTTVLFHIHLVYNVDRKALGENHFIQGKNLLFEKSYDIYGALREFTLAASYGHKEAGMYIIIIQTDLISSGAGVSSFDVREQMAMQVSFGNKLALAISYLNGWNVPIDYEQCVKLLKAEIITKENPIAMYYLAKCYEIGVGIDRNLYKAMKMYRRSETMGYRKSYGESVRVYALMHPST